MIARSASLRVWAKFGRGAIRRRTKVGIADWLADGRGKAWAVGLRGGVFGPMHSAREELPERGALLGIEGLQHIVFDVLLRTRGPLKGLAACGREVDPVPAAILGVAATDQV